LRLLLPSLLLLVATEPARAFRIFDAAPAMGVSQPVYVRWDAAPRDVWGEERSLDGGLRYSLEGGSYQAFRDQLLWSQVPTTDAFEAAVKASFDFWTVVDPSTGLGTSLAFVEDLGTEIWDDQADNGGGPPSSWIGPNYGAEIDIIANTPDIDAIASVVAYVDLASANRLTLTSGTTNYRGFAFSGADIRIDPNHVWNIELFQTVLTHEIGHAIGFADFWQYPGVGGAFSPFLDDNYDGTNSATARATLNNSFALLIDPYDPDSSPLLKIAAPLDSDPGLYTWGVHMVMEELFVPILSNNEFAGRQFLYPFVVPEPALVWLVAPLALAVAGRPGS
jgi:hypothetical protein